MEDHEGRHVLFAGQFGTQAAQGVEQGQILRQYRQSGALCAALASAGAAGRVAAHADLAAAGQHVTAGIGQAQAAVALAVHFQQAGGDQLAEHAAPGARIQVAADRVGAQLVVALLPHFLVLAASQHVNQMADAETLAAAVDTAQRLLRWDGRVP